MRADIKSMTENMTLANEIRQQKEEALKGSEMDNQILTKKAKD